MKKELFVSLDSGLYLKRLCEQKFQSFIEVFLRKMISLDKNVFTR